MGERALTGPQKPAESLVFAQEKLRVDLQCELHNTLLRTGVRKAKLARRLGITRMAVNSLFEADWNPGIMTLCRIFHALGCELRFEIVCAEPDPKGGDRV